MVLTSDMIDGETLLCLVQEFAEEKKKGLEKTPSICERKFLMLNFPFTNSSIKF